MNREQLCIRDPFILAWEDKYLLTGTVGMPGWKQGIYGFLTEDLETFSDPILLFDPPENFWADRDFWAPEIHQYRGQYYMFVSFRSHFRRRATQVLVHGERQRHDAHHDAGDEVRLEFSERIVRHCRKELRLEVDWSENFFHIVKKT